MVPQQDESILSQIEPDRLIKSRKKVISPESLQIPTIGNKKVLIHLKDLEAKTDFLVDVLFNRRPYTLKGKCQLRVHRMVRLLRLDSNGRVHSNLDDSLVDGTHLHIYKEGSHDRWAYPPPENIFSNLEDAATTLREFLVYCNVTNIPTIR